jgi:hypothetical protein
MKFNTITSDGDGYEIFPGATFEWFAGFHSAPARIHPSSKYNLSGQRSAPEHTIAVSNELLLSQDALIQNDGTHVCGLTILRAAVRLGEKAILVPESEAARCEVQHRAVAVWIPTPSRLPTDTGPVRVVEFDPGKNPKLARQILMPGLAILTEVDLLGVRIFERGKRDLGWPKGMVDYQTLVDAFNIEFDGTNVKLDCVKVKLPPQECFV